MFTGDMQCQGGGTHISLGHRPRNQIIPWQFSAESAIQQAGSVHYAPGADATSDADVIALHRAFSAERIG